MIETLVLLIGAHVTSDFVLQTRRVSQNKARPVILGLHGLWTAAAIAVFLGGLPWLILAIVVPSHLALDYAKARGVFARLGLKPFNAFLVDQAGHALAIFIAAAAAPGAFAAGLWMQPPAFWPEAMTAPAAWGDNALSIIVVLSGFILSTRAASFAIALLMQPFAAELDGRGTPASAPPLERKYMTDAGGANGLVHGDDRGLTGAGALIGMLERSLAFILILADQFAGIGFLIAAKSVLRFQYARDRSHSEYVIIGTMASFGWALAVGLGTKALLARL